MNEDEAGRRWRARRPGAPRPSGSSRACDHTSSAASTISAPAAGTPHPRWRSRPRIVLHEDRDAVGGGARAHRPASIATRCSPSLTSRGMPTTMAPVTFPALDPSAGPTTNPARSFADLSAAWLESVRCAHAAGPLPCFGQARAQRGLDDVELLGPAINGGESCTTVAAVVGATDRSRPRRAAVRRTRAIGPRPAAW